MSRMDGDRVGYNFTLEDARRVAREELTTDEIGNLVCCRILDEALRQQMISNGQLRSEIDARDSYIEALQADLVKFHADLEEVIEDARNKEGAEWRTITISEIVDVTQLHPLSKLKK